MLGALEPIPKTEKNRSARCPYGGASSLCLFPPAETRKVYTTAFPFLVELEGEDHTMVNHLCCFRHSSKQYEVLRISELVAYFTKKIPASS